MIKRNRDFFLDPTIKTDHLLDKILYYPCSGEDYYEPIEIFRDIISEFWFVDRYYLQNRLYSPLEIDGLKFVETLVAGQLEFEREFRISEKGTRYNYLEPCMQKDFYEYDGRIITIVRRRGFDYNSLFGPSTLETAENRLGIFFYRGDGRGERGSGHRWMSITPRKMIADSPKVSLLNSVIDALPDGGLLATDGSNSSLGSKRRSGREYAELTRFLRSGTSSIDAYKSVNAFTDSRGNLFSCAGYASYRYGPTLIWQIVKK